MMDVEIIYPQLSYKLMGVLFEVQRKFGGGYQEKYYQRAIANLLRQEKIPFFEQAKVDLEICGVNLGRYYIDFIVDGKIILEIKSKNTFSYKDVRQILAYLKKTGFKLGILASFTSKRLIYKRILKGRN
jgi:GxxExxY protein